MKQTIEELSRKLNLEPKVIENTYKAYWKFIHDTIVSLPLKEDLDEETFSKLKLNFNLPNLGKLACTYKRYVRIKKAQKFIKEKKHDKCQKS